MKGVDALLQFVLHILLLRLESRIFEFGFFDGFNQEKLSLLASVVVAPWLVTMPTQSLHGSVAKLLSRKFLWLRGSTGSGWSCAKEIIALNVYSRHALTSHLISCFNPSMKSLSTAFQINLEFDMKDARTWLDILAWLRFDESSWVDHSGSCTSLV
ncbi:hypothetical protein B296_00013029 [Ensete ventricosum]|uniref:Uncharacterized protein n=1 Tax=Ensete ventricosum TaxID=4639 RepID=A0A427B8N8_ENSVE|nr:hypothetical protein B296_00013029 [Ensete ventricosum]